MRFSTWNVRSLYRTCSLITVAREIAKYKLRLVRAQEIRLDRGDTEPAGEYTIIRVYRNESNIAGPDL
jgi:hypothetical protein